jgi:hypothetical protein
MLLYSVAIMLEVWKLEVRDFNLSFNAPLRCTITLLTGPQINVGTARGRPNS